MKLSLEVHSGGHGSWLSNIHLRLATGNLHLSMHRSNLSDVPGGALPEQVLTINYPNLQQHFAAVHENKQSNLHFRKH